MPFVDELFKDDNPRDTVNKIRAILADLQLTVHEKMHNSGIDNCYSCTVFCNSGTPRANGKGVSEDLARASAYGELIERIQGGMFLYKFQSIIRNPSMNVHSFAPDAKYITAEELLADSQWMDYIIEAYPNLGITKESIVEHCRAFACSDDDKILVLPFYSILENKHVNLPIAFVDQVYGSNGCCAGNSREEAWVHALSEIMERHATLKMLMNGSAAPKIPEEIISKFPVVHRIYSQICDSGRYSLEFFDYSIGNGFPVVLARIIDKKNHTYRVNIGADPILEIAMQRTLTELFQGATYENVTFTNNVKILRSVNDYPITTNVLNQLETGDGLYTADFFAEHAGISSLIEDQNDELLNRNNKELLDYMISLYRKLGKPIYVRNFSYLGFPSYRFVVPGFSEALAVHLSDIVPEYAIADDISRIMRDVGTATFDDLNMLLSYHNVISDKNGRYMHFGRLAGIPISGIFNIILACVTRAEAAYRLRKYSDAVKYLRPCISGCDSEMQNYLECVIRYLVMVIDGIESDKIKNILYKFFSEESVNQLYSLIDTGKSPFADMLVKCDYHSCDICNYRNNCSFNSVKSMNERVAKIYQGYVNGQDPKEFAI